MMTTYSKRLPWLVVIWACLGCASSSGFKWSKDEFRKATLRDPAVRVLGLWEPSQGMVGQKQCRGFSGQILFFTANNAEPVQVDGKVTIYLYSDDAMSGKSEEEAIPIETFIYPADVWKQLVGKGPLGPTYTVSIPYKRPGTNEVRCSLRIKFEPKTGFNANSEMTSIILPGAKGTRVKDPDDLLYDVGSQPTAIAEQMLARAKAAEKSSRQASATNIPTTGEVQEMLQSKRSRVVELSERERRRLIQEATANLPQEQRDRLTLVDDPAEGAMKRRVASASRKQSVKQAAYYDEDEFDTADDDSGTRSAGVRGGRGVRTVNHQDDAWDFDDED